MRIVVRKLISMAIVIINRTVGELSVRVVMIARSARFTAKPTQNALAEISSISGLDVSGSAD